MLVKECVNAVRELCFEALQLGEVLRHIALAHACSSSSSSRIQGRLDTQHCRTDKPAIANKAPEFTLRAQVLPLAQGQHGLWCMLSVLQELDVMRCSVAAAQEQDDLFSMQLFSSESLRQPPHLLCVGTC